jgi:hypothetical protein
VIAGEQSEYGLESKKSSSLRETEKRQTKTMEGRICKKIRDGEKRKKMGVGRGERKKS